MVGTGPPRTEPLRGVGRSGRESVMAVDRFCRNAVVRTYGSARPGFRSVGKVHYLCRVCVLSLSIVAQFVVGHTIGSRLKWRINLLIINVITKM